MTRIILHFCLLFNLFYPIIALSNQSQPVFSITSKFVSEKLKKVYGNGQPFCIEFDEGFDNELPCMDMGVAKSDPMFKINIYYPKLIEAQQDISISVRNYGDIKTLDDEGIKKFKPQTIQLKKGEKVELLFTSDLKVSDMVIRYKSEVLMFSGFRFAFSFPSNSSEGEIYYETIENSQKKTLSHFRRSLYEIELASLQTNNLSQFLWMSLFIDKDPYALLKLDNNFHIYKWTNGQFQSIRQFSLPENIQLKNRYKFKDQILEIEAFQYDASGNLGARDIEQLFASNEIPLRVKIDLRDAKIEMQINKTDDKDHKELRAFTTMIGDQQKGFFVSYRDIFVYDGELYRCFKMDEINSTNLKEIDYTNEKPLDEVHLKFLTQTKIPVYDQVWNVKKVNLDNHGIQVSQKEDLLNTGRIKEHLTALDQQNNQQYFQKVRDRYMKKFDSHQETSKFHANNTKSIAVKIPYKNENYLLVAWTQIRLAVPKTMTSQLTNDNTSLQTNEYIIAYYKLLADGSLGEEIDTLISGVPLEMGDFNYEMNIIEFIGFDTKQQQYFLRLKHAFNGVQNHVYYLTDRKEELRYMP